MFVGVAKLALYQYYSSPRNPCLKAFFFALSEMSCNRWLVVVTKPLRSLLRIIALILHFKSWRAANNFDSKHHSIVHRPARSLFA